MLEKYFPNFKPKSIEERWDKAGKLKAVRHPMNNYRLYKLEELQRLAKQLEL